MYAEERREEIAVLVRQNGRGDVVELAGRFAVTPETIRRDLSDLERSGVLRRVHGGAIPIEGRLVAVADKEFTDGESVKGHQTVQEILNYATQAHDLAINNRKKMKDTEIHLRRCRHALENVRRTLAAEDRPAAEAVEKKLEQFGQDILEAMFAPPKKEKK